MICDWCGASGVVGCASAGELFGVLCCGLDGLGLGVGTQGFTLGWYIYPRWGSLGRWVDG